MSVNLPVMSCLFVAPDPDCPGNDFLNTQTIQINGLPTIDSATTEEDCMMACQQVRLSACLDITTVVYQDFPPGVYLVTQNIFDEEQKLR